MRVLRLYHSGRDPAHRLRERALVEAGVDVHLAVPDGWPDPGCERDLGPEPFPMHELPVRRPGDVNRHTYDARALRRVIREVDPDVLDLHAEPVSAAVHQVLSLGPLPPVCLYTAQNLDKRYPPPFAQWERQALRAVSAVYACSRQAASVARGKGFAGHLDVLPLGVDPQTFIPGEQRPDDAEIVLGFVGRFVPEKGIADAVAVLDQVRRARPTRLVTVGSGEPPPGAEHHAWSDAASLADHYRRMHFVLVPSRTTPSWVEQFGRVVVEAQACGAVVAAYDSGALDETVGGAGIVVPEGEPRSMAAAILSLLERGYDERRGAGVARAARCAWANVAAGQARMYAKTAEPAQRHPAGRAAARAEFGLPAAGGRRFLALPRALRDLARLIDRQ